MSSAGDGFARGEEVGADPTRSLRDCVARSRFTSTATASTG
jgi:hypothetical protein